MKPRRYQHDFFNQWRDNVVSKLGPYYWPQIDYDTYTKEPIHICFELSVERQGHIFWPCNSQDLGSALPFSNIDFAGDVARIQLNDQEMIRWDDLQWSNFLKQCRSDVLGKLFSYEHFHRGEVSCVDIDCIEKTRSGHFVGIETTSLYVEMKTESKAKSLFGDILEKRLLRDGAHQLLVQNNFLRSCNIPHYLLVYNEVGEGNSRALHHKGNCLSLRIDDGIRDAFINKNKDLILLNVKYAPFLDTYKKLVGYVE